MMKSSLFSHKPLQICLLISLVYLFYTPYTFQADPDGFIGAHYSLQEVLDVFNKEEYKDNPSVIKAVKLYQALADDVGNVSQYENNHPFIAVEGNHRSRRFIVARQLARSLKASNLRNPPEFMNFLKFDFKEVEIRRAFYSLALYANALEAQRIVAERPVITSGYWMDIAAFALAKKYPTDFPDKNSSEMSWPKDLFAPDIIFYINSPPPDPSLAGSLGTTKPPNPLKPRLVDVYRIWTYPRVVELSGSIFSYNEMFTEMFRHINYIRQSKFKQYIRKNKRTLARPYVNKNEHNLIYE